MTDVPTPVTDATARSILDLPMPDNDADASTVRDYLGKLELGHYYITATADGHIKEIDLTGLTKDEWRDRPRRIKRTVHLTDVMGLQDYCDKYANVSSECWADRDNRTITAIIDAHIKASDVNDPVADWCQHTATVRFELSKPLQAWLNHDGKLMRQEAFAEWVEENVPFIVHPAAADLKELAETFQATTTAKFQSGVRLRDGQRTLSYIEQIDASVKDGQVVVPATITLALPMWRGDTEPTTFTARIRYRVNTPGPGQLSIAYVLDRPQDLIDEAFETAVDAVCEHIDRPVFNGSPGR